ncbi:GDSL-type esterase/lipase family protein [Flagellimonas myxillae]|uniref:GDSL-type esterase/lipase family protein n=1 Tax=Flagellimonas myxillae TaxID=2942214 RepID=UPI00201E9A8E|nr:GDSL-type esterase/lipase family protein [Muricauda myxillae]MCL6267105.1 GDSL-type esterase/lipase family protein [Muricauda myxillae]
MRNFLFVMGILVVLASSCQKTSNANRASVKIACVGNSITYGAGMANREMNAYPEQLQRLLGEKYQVENFGVNAATLLKKGNNPYWETDKYQEALDFAPLIVLIKLGTNDSKLQNRKYLDTDFEKDYKDLIASFKAQNQNARIVLLLPVPSFLQDSTSIWNPIIKEKVIPLAQKVAYETGSEVVDLYQLFDGDESMFPDKIHPSSLGATKIARRVYEQLVQKTASSFQPLENLDVAIESQQNFHGFQQTNFKYAGLACKVVQPKRTAKGRPWVLRSRFWGHEPQTDIALLERGYHIAYCDVANLFGNKEAVERWNTFYELMTKAGLSEKVVLEGMSRGGLIMYNWASENPEKVICTYADAPVLDGTSWPGGKGEGLGSTTDWEQFKKVYEITNEKKLDQFTGNPIHKTTTLAKAGFPMLHVCGEADKVVPVAENTTPFEQKIKAAGGNIKTVYKPDVGHHPHSLANPSPIVDFILRASNRKINFATVPAPGSEYRSAAGWKEGKGWWYQMYDIDSLSRYSGKLDLLLVGNSITQGWGGNRTLTTYKPGLEAAQRSFNGLKWVSAGISGDRTEHTAWRIQNGHYDEGSPEFVSLAIGVNNFPYNSAEEIAEGIALNVKLLRSKLPNSKILLFGPLPTGLDHTSERRKKYRKIHELIAPLGNQESVQYFNLEATFSDEKGNLKETLYGGDGIHLKPGGYEVWGEFIQKQIQKK